MSQDPKKCDRIGKEYKSYLIIEDICISFQNQSTFKTLLYLLLNNGLYNKFYHLLYNPLKNCTLSDS